MKWIDRQGNILPDDSDGRLLNLMYGTSFGRAALGIFTKPFVSNIAGAFMDSALSRVFIGGFVKKNGIDTASFEERKYHSFNDFFTRRIKPGKRVVDTDADHLISPCDCKLTVYPIEADSRFEIKGTVYTLESLLRDGKLAQEYRGGTLLIFRLTVGDYHRYCYIDSGIKSDNVHIDGVYHTVNPIACERYPIYKENTREYCTIQSETFGKIVMMEVGALMVGRIVNRHGAQPVTRGEEKGKFEFGGSTIVALLQKDRVIIDKDILENTANGFETVVKYGEKIGTREAEK
ncbi:MAG: phosphatidylserine decarboxylase [Clostridia bacterium]|nr:phosphatidylserine decarboxylase [Clostridia bacterium]MBR5902960.1 phosphatidylserine decarboxylase [Clostridia bacterium]